MTGPATTSSESAIPWHLDDRLVLGCEYRLKDGSSVKLISRDTMYITTSKGKFYLPDFLRDFLDASQFESLSG